MPHSHILMREIHRVRPFRAPNLLRAPMERLHTDIRRVGPVAHQQPRTPETELRLAPTRDEERPVVDGHLESFMRGQVEPRWFGIWKLQDLGPGEVLAFCVVGVEQRRGGIEGLERRVQRDTTFECDRALDEWIGRYGKCWRSKGQTRQRQEEGGARRHR